MPLVTREEREAPSFRPMLPTRNCFGRMHAISRRCACASYYASSARVSAFSLLIAASDVDIARRRQTSFQQVGGVTPLRMRRHATRVDTGHRHAATCATRMRLRPKKARPEECHISAGQRGALRHFAAPASRADRPGCQRRVFR